MGSGVEVSAPARRNLITIGDIANLEPQDFLLLFDPKK